MDRPKRRCVARKTAVPSAVHYVGYVEDDETPEMIMRKFEELERMMAASKKEEIDTAAAAPLKEAGPCSSGQPGAKQLSMEAEPQSSLQHQEQPGQDAQAAHAGSGDQVLDDATLLQVFKMTSIFNVKSAMSNNQVLMAGPGADSAVSGSAHPFCGLRSADLDAADQGGLGEVTGAWSLYDAADISGDMEDEDDADWCDQVKELWSDEDEMEVHASASASNLCKRKGDGGGNTAAWPRRPAGAPRERRPPQAGRHKGAIPTGRGRTDALLQRMARIPWIFQDREAVNKPTPPPSTWAAPWIYVLGPPKAVMPKPAASTLPQQTQLAQAQQQLPPAPLPPAFLQPLAPPPPPLRQPSEPRPPASSLSYSPRTSLPASVHTCLQPPQPPSLRPPLTCLPTRHTHAPACPAPPPPPMTPMPHMPPMPPLPPAPQPCPIPSQNNPPCQPPPPPPNPAALPNAKRPPVPPPVLMPAKRAAHAPLAPPPLMQPRVRAASRSPSPPPPPAPPPRSAAPCHGAVAGQQGLIVGSGTESGSGSGWNGGSYHHQQPCPQPLPSAQGPPCTHQGSGSTSSGLGNEGCRQSRHAGCMPLGGGQAQQGWSTSQHSVLPQSRDGLNNVSQSQAGVLDLSNTGAVPQALPPPVLGRIVLAPSSNLVPQGEGGPPPGVVVEAEDITRLHFQALLKQRKGVPFQLVVVNPGWEEPPPGTTTSATPTTASATAGPAPTQAQQQQPALAPPPPPLPSRSAPAGAVGGGEIDAGSSEAVDGEDSGSSDDDEEEEEDVVARLRALPMTRLCPRGFVAVWARKAVMARVCKQLGAWGYVYVESLSWVWVQPPPSHRLLALPAPCLRASHLTLLIFRRAGDAGRDMHLAHQRSADVVVDALKPAQGCPFQPPLEAMSALEVMLPSAHQGGACLELWAPSTTAGQAQAGGGRPGWTQVVETGGS